jgi:hypothetical protein
MYKPMAVLSMTWKTTAWLGYPFSAEGGHDMGQHKMLPCAEKSRWQIGSSDNPLHIQVVFHLMT